MKKFRILNRSLFVDTEFVMVLCRVEVLKW